MKQNSAKVLFTFIQSNLQYCVHSEQSYVIMQFKNMPGGIIWQVSKNVFTNIILFEQVIIEMCTPPAGEMKHSPQCLC